MIFLIPLVFAVVGLVILFHVGGSTYPKKRLERAHKQLCEHLALAEWSGAFRLLDKLGKKQKLDPSILPLRLELLRQTSRFEEALSLSEAVLREDPSLLLVWRERAKVLLEWGDMEGALHAFSQCQQVLHDERDWSLVASAHLQLGHPQRAWDVLSKWLDDRASIKALTLAGDCQYALNHYAEALHLYRKIEAPSTKVLTSIAHCHRHFGDLELACHTFTRVLKEQPHDPSAIINLGLCLEKQKRHVEALQVYQGETSWSLLDPRIIFRAGVAAVHTQKYRYALLYFAQAKEGGILSANLLAYEGYSFEKLAHWKKAEEVYLELTKRYPTHAGGYRGLAWLFGVGLSTHLVEEEGLIMARKSVEMISDTSAWEILSACEARMGNFGEAHRIQECLLSQESDRSAVARRQAAMRSLRKGEPLGEELVARSLVA